MQFKIHKNIFIIPTISFTTMFDDVEAADFFNFDYSSAGITAGYKSPFGQIKLNYSKAFNKDSQGLFTVILGHWF